MLIVFVMLVMLVAGNLIILALWVVWGALLWYIQVLARAKQGSIMHTAAKHRGCTQIDASYSHICFRATPAWRPYLAAVCGYHTKQASTSIDIRVQASAGDMKPFDPFEILGIPTDASSSEIKKAYRQLSLKYHPDKVRLNGHKSFPRPSLVAAAP